MIKQATLAGAILTGLVLAGPLHAEETMCPRSPNAKLMTKAELMAKAKAAGYDVRGIRPRDGCWELKGFNKNGERVELHIDPVTAEIKQDEG
jgi:hypothetical protein